MKLGIGTVQFGLDYGISNAGGITPVEEVRAVLALARKKGIRVLDTATSYGLSEEVLGGAMADDEYDIVTKTPRFDMTSSNQNPLILERAFHSSLKKMARLKLFGLLIHNADDVLGKCGSQLIEKMRELKEGGFVEKIGVSVYSSHQIDRVLERFEIDLVQIPISVLDQRLLASGHLARLKDSGIEVHARSVFLQGLLLMRPEELPKYFNPIKTHLKYYHESLSEIGLTPLQAAISFVAGLEKVDVVICGINNQFQLEEICDSLLPVDPGYFSQFAVEDERFLNPSFWEK